MEEHERDNPREAEAALLESSTGGAHKDQKPCTPFTKNNPHRLRIQQKLSGLRILVRPFHYRNRKSKNSTSWRSTHYGCNT
eukprot:2541143-Pleurochrysis_carterae.AAC.1